MFNDRRPQERLYFDRATSKRVLESRIESWDVKTILNWKDRQTKWLLKTLGIGMRRDQKNEGVSLVAIYCS